MTTPEATPDVSTHREDFGRALTNAALNGLDTQLRATFAPTYPRRDDRLRLALEALTTATLTLTDAERFAR